MRFIKHLVILTYFLCGTTTYAAVFNTDFEDGMPRWAIERPAGYAQGSIEVQNAVVKEGNGALRLVATADNSIARITSERIPLPENRDMAFKGWYRYYGKDSALEVRVRSINANGVIMEPWQDYFQFHRLEEAKEWTQFSVPLSIHADARHIDITITYSGGSGEAYFDNLEIHSLTAPVTPSVGYMLEGIGSQQMRFSVESPLKRIYHDSKPPSAIGSGLSLSAAKGETEAVQLVLWPEAELNNLQVRFGALQGPATLSSHALQAHYVGEVDVKLPDSLGRSGLIPDPLFRKPPAQVAKGKPQSIWLNVHVPRDATAGTYSGKVLVSADNLQPVAIPLTVQIYDFELPLNPSFTTLARIWNFPVEGESGPNEAREYFRSNLQQYRISGEQTVAELPIKVTRDGQVAIDWTTWDAEATEYFSKYGLTVFNVPNVYLGNWSGFSGKAKDGTWFGLKIGSDEWRKGFGSYVRQVAERLRQKDQLKHALWQVWDEPVESQHDTIRMVADLIHDNAPDARVYVVTHLQPGLFGAVDVWCVPESMYNAELAKTRRAAGDEVWIYENFLYKLDLDTTPFLLRSYPWTLYRHDITGLEWWAITHWETNPYQNTRQGKLTNGNGFMIYPDHETKTFPINSIRWEAYRDGLEDHDYLSLLVKAWDEALKQERIVNPEVTGEMVAKKLAGKLFQSDFSPVLDVKQLIETRRYIAETIEQLKANPTYVRELNTSFRQ